MAYNIARRTPSPPKYFTFYDPGAYQSMYGKKISIKSVSKVPFLAKSPRVTAFKNKLWTHAIYDSDVFRKIPNITSLSSKIPRFPYDSLTDDDIKELLCRCGIDDSCECKEEEKVNEDCDANSRRRLFKGATPYMIKFNNAGGSYPSPPFYNVNINECNTYYRGCKWSKWNSSRSVKCIDVGPGPAAYNIEQPPTENKIYAENVRHLRRKESKQMRYIEAIQKKHLTEGFPGPATYSPTFPKGTNLLYVGSKTDRFPKPKYDEKPGPGDYNVKRDFDLSLPPEAYCHAKLPKPSCFGNKANRFKPLREEGPSPASYTQNIKQCVVTRCSKAAFNSSLQRFKDLSDYDDDEDIEPEHIPKKYKEPIKSVCTSTWPFKSRTLRMKPLTRVNNDLGPADMPPTITKPTRQPESQYAAPFYSSEGRFSPWHDWMPVFGKEKTPGPCYYCLEKPKSRPAVNSGPLYRTPRFPQNTSDIPPPNKYNNENFFGIEDVLSTHNKRLQENIRNKPRFEWHPPEPRGKLSLQQKHYALLQKTINLLNTHEKSQ